MSYNLCSICKKPKASLTCGLCSDDVCKNCTEFLSETAFSFLKKVPEELSHTTYCSACFDESVASALGQYNETLERAKEVFVFFTTQKKKIPLLKRGREKVEVKSCPDRDETIMRLAFFAAELSFNAIIEVSVVSEKVRNFGYQKSNWQGVGIPAFIDEAKMRRQEAQE